MKREAPVIKPTKTHSAEVRRLVHGARVCTLATVMAEGGAPYASLVTMAADHDGSPILLLSGLADHTRNLEADPRLSLLIDEARALPNPQTGPRVSLLGRAEKVEGPAVRDRLAGRFLARHPGAALYAGFGDFAFWRVVPERAHLVGGFARAVWLTNGLLRDPAVAAAFAEVEPHAVAHMNADHADAVAAIAQAFVKGAFVGGATGVGWRMVALDAQGLAVRNGEDEKVFHIPFDPPLAAPDEVRARLVDLSRTARGER